MAERPPDATRWQPRPVVATVVVVAVFVVPVVLSIGAAALVGNLWHPAATVGGTALRWVAILGASTLVFVGGERFTRRVLPLTVLLRMGMVFPGRAPRRLSVALRSWTTKDLSRRIDEARSQGVTDEPIVAAEKIVSLAATLSAHDRKTRGHAERVRAYTDLIAEELRLPDDDRDRLRWSALLHDVGKLTVHTDVLNKPGQLSEGEWELMRQHPLEGAKLTAPLAAWLGPWANTIAEHHERFDGRGYPSGLGGQEISTGGRIVAVADSYDTMTSVRSYNKPMSTDAARAELATCAGAQFDPVIVRAFLAVSVSRLRAVAPLTWLGSLPFGNLGPQLARAVATGGRVGVTGVAAAVGVVALAGAHHGGGVPGTSHLAAVNLGISPGSPGTPSSVSVGAPGSQSRAAGNAGSSSFTDKDPGARGGAPGSGAGSDATPTGDAGANVGGAPSAGGRSDAGNSGAGGGSGGGTGSATTVVSGQTPDTPTTTGGSLPPGTTSTTRPTPTTTTTAPLAPLGAPSGLSASGGCQVLVLGPEITLTWTASATTRVTGYAILRSTGKTSTYSNVATVSGRTIATYADTTVSGLGKTYWYEIEAVAGAAASSPSAPVSGATPTLCL
jgi:hypothetical protein